MQPEAWQIHVSNHSGSIEARQNVPQLFGVFADHAANVIVLVKAL
jgi:hypothetical protein